MRRLTIRTLSAERDSARATLEGLRSEVRQAGQSYASTHGETDSQVNNAAAALKAAVASLEESQANERQQALDTKRTVSLAEQGVASQQDRDRAEQTLAADQARVRSNREQVIAAQATLNTMQARIQSGGGGAQQHRRHGGADGLGQRQAGRSRSTASATPASSSPVDGTVSVRAAREGEVVNVGTPIVTIVDLTQTWVYAAIPETQDRP